MKKIIEKLASKELSFGCLVKEDGGSVLVYLGFDDMKHYWKDDRENIFSGPLIETDESLGHPFLIVNFMRYLKEKTEFFGDYMFGCDGKIYHAKGGDPPYLEVAIWPTEKSLQQIFEESGYEVGCEYCNEGKNKALLNASDFHLEGDEPVEIEESCEECGGDYLRLKDPKARELEQFISNLIL